MKLSTITHRMETHLSGLILRLLKRRKTLKASDVVRKTGFSRAYVHRHLHALCESGKIVLLGRANKARYVLAGRNARETAKAERRHFLRTYEIKNLQEDRVWDQIVAQTGIVYDVSRNIIRIVQYGFTEMLNNAIEHSRSKLVKVRMQRSEQSIRFSVVDYGIGIFRNIKLQRGLRDEKEAIQDLLKGKQTTAPQAHSGEGIFFTSRLADRLVIKSSRKRLIFDNDIDDIVIDKTSVNKGTAVDFSIRLTSKSTMSGIFRQFTGEGHDFSKTEVRVALYKAGRNFISRSQARRLLAGLDTFKHISLDFHNVEAVGQGFADEIFRVWKHSHPGRTIEVLHSNENVTMMIARAKSGDSEAAK
jgi:anti-sigma regulatory factor (Ser/Thr protein kinase)